MFSVLQLGFSSKLFTRLGWAGGEDLKDPGAVFLLIATVQVAVVAGAGLPHLPTLWVAETPSWLKCGS